MLHLSKHQLCLPRVSALLYTKHQRVSGIFLCNHFSEHISTIAAVYYPYTVYAL